MTQICATCQTPSEGAARFCTNCGAALAATSVGGRTLVLTRTQTERTRTRATDVSAIADIARRAFGDAHAQIPTQVANTAAVQRELLYLVLDCSGSMACDMDGTMRKLEAATRAGCNLVTQKARIDGLDEVGIVTFTSTAGCLLRHCPVGANRARIIQTLQSLTADGGTDLDTGLRVAEENFDWRRTDIVRRICLLTDGQGGDPLARAESLRGRGVVIDVVGVGPSPERVDESLLRRMASVIQGVSRYRFIRDSQTLLAHHTALATKTHTS